jgi:hypothetical protein
MLFALDTSGSARQHVTRQSEAALAMFTRFGDNSRIAVLPFSEQADFTLAFTDDVNRARAAFQLSPRRGRHTAIFDAASVAVRAFNVAGADARERRIILLFSDGLDTSSRTPHASVINDALLRGVSIYVIHIPLYTPREGRLVARRPAKGFRELAEQTGGHYFNSAMLATRSTRAPLTTLSRSSARSLKIYRASTCSATTSTHPRARAANTALR